MTPTVEQLANLFVETAMHQAGYDANVFSGPVAEAIANQLILNMIQQVNFFGATDTGKEVPAYVAFEALSKAVTILKANATVNAKE